MMHYVSMLFALVLFIELAVGFGPRYLGVDFDALVDACIRILDIGVFILGEFAPEPVHKGWRRNEWSDYPLHGKVRNLE